MTVFSIFHRYRFPFLLLSLWIVIVFFLGDESTYSHTATSELVNTHKIVLSKNTSSLSVTENVNKAVLENGLTVLTKEVHTSPVVTVQVWYKMGSRNEEPGVNGIAHQLEHMMFRGTKNRPIQFGRLFSALGSDSNAFTSYDQTAYYNTAERNKLRALLELEADRMHNALIDPVQLANEKRVVISELQGYENSPEYRLNRAVLEAAFPNHVYGLPVGGTKADVEKFKTQQVQEYYQNFYSPDNAVLVIVGDFQTEPTLKVVKDIFGKIPQGVRIEELRVRSQKTHPPTPNTPQRQFHQVGKPFRQSPPPGNPSAARQHHATDSPTPLILKEPGAAGLLQAVYPLPNANHPDVPALNVMDYILTEGRNARLYQALVESGLVNDVSASVINLVDAGWYELLVTADPDQDLTKIDLVLKNAIAKLVKRGVTPEEVKRAKLQLEAALILTNRDIVSIAMQLGDDETTVGDYRYTERYLEAIRKITPDDVQQVAKKYLAPELRTVGFFEPTQIQAKVPGNRTKSSYVTENFVSGTSITREEVEKYLPSVDCAQTHFSQTIPEQFTLSNGLRVLLLPDSSSPTVTLTGFIRAGKEFDPEQKAGLASLVTDNLMNGTKTKDALTIAKVLEDRGASLDFETYREGVKIEGDSLASDLSILVETLADIVKNTTFPKKELELSRQQALTELKQELDDPSEVAERTFVQSLYPKKHPLHIFPTQQSLRLLSRQDIIEFKQKHYRPDTTVLVLLGDFVPTQVKELLKTAFGDWNAIGQPAKVEYPTVSLPEKAIRLSQVIPGKAQTITYMGNKGINRQDSRFYAASVLNQILGGDTLSSRLGAEVRDRLGLTYGIYSNFLVGKNTGTFLIEMQTSPEDTNRAIASTRELLEQIHQQGVTEEEVNSAKHTLISNYTVSLSNPEELAYRILMNEVYGLGTEELLSFADKIRAITLNDVNKAARELLYPDKIVIVTAGPAVFADKGTNRQ
jgi:zinc protease